MDKKISVSRFLQQARRTPGAKPPLPRQSPPPPPRPGWPSSGQVSAALLLGLGLCAVAAVIADNLSPAPPPTRAAPPVPPAPPQHYDVPQSQGPAAWHDTPPTPAPDHTPPTRAAAPPIKEPPPFKAQVFVATENNVETMIGQHFEFYTTPWLEYCPPGVVLCSKQPEGLGYAHTGFTVLGLVSDEKYHVITRAKLKLDDGTIVFDSLPSSWLRDSEAAAARADLAHWAAYWAALCESAPPIAIGMTEREVPSSKWGKPNSVNTTETANVVRAQWVYESGPICHEGGKSRRSYLYFENGRVVAIQR